MVVLLVASEFEGQHINVKVDPAIDLLEFPIQSRQLVLVLFHFLLFFHAYFRGRIGRFPALRLLLQFLAKIAEFLFSPLVEQLLHVSFNFLFVVILVNHNLIPQVEEGRLISHSLLQIHFGWLRMQIAESQHCSKVWNELSDAHDYV